MFKALVADEPTIFKFKIPAVGLLMEWHRLTQKMYLVVLDETLTKGHGILIGENIKDHGEAINLAHMWNRGYQFAKREHQLKDMSNATKQRSNESGILAIAEPD